MKKKREVIVKTNAIINRLFMKSNLTPEAVENVVGNIGFNNGRKNNSLRKCL